MESNMLFIWLCCFLIVYTSAAAQKYVSYAGDLFQLSCSSKTTPVWFKDDDAAQTLAIGERKAARFTDQR